jgi:7-keto-8-aminopelargonate synthetase-like enzyme
MVPTQFYEQLKRDRAPLEGLRFNPYYQPNHGLNAGRPLIRGETYFDLASNDYLGLASDPRVHEAMIAAIRQYGSSLCGTPIATGYAQCLAELECSLARFVGLESAVIFPSCYQANLALFSTVAASQDIIFVDHYAHASLAHGIKCVGCKVKPFLHNNLAHLERQLAASGAFRQIFVVTESVFSTEGSVAPLKAIVDLCRPHDAIPVVDDSHGIGVLGQTGRGILEEQGVADYPGVYTASLGKALAHAGGMVSGPQALIDALRYSCPGLIYSTALPPAGAGGILRVLEIIRKEFGRLKDALWRNHSRLVESLRGLGFELAPAQAPIAAIRCGSTEDTLRLAERFFEHHILATAFVPPSVPPEAGVLRLIVGAKLQDPAMRVLLTTLNRLSAVPPTPGTPSALARVPFSP